MNGKKLIRFSLLALIIVAFNFNETGWMPFFVLIFAFFLFLYKAKYKINELFKIPIELKLLLCWLIWSLITGLFVSENYELFFSNFKTASTLIFTCVIIYIALKMDPKAINYVMIGLIISGVLQIMVIKFGLQPEEHIGKEREYGLSGNPNSLGLKMVYASFALLYLIMISEKRKIFYWILTFIGFYLFFEVILISGSRKSALSFAILLAFGLSIFILNRYKKINLFKLFVSILFLAVIGYFLTPSLIEGTVLGDRFQTLDESGGVESDIRYSMYQFGLELFYDNPIFGIGLNNYRVHFYSGQYSHSDYIESLASTGIVGFVLYQLGYFLLMFKALRSFILSKTKSERITNGLVFSGVLVLKVIGLGIILYVSPSAMIVFVTLLAMYYNNKNKMNETHLVYN